VPIAIASRALMLGGNLTSQLPFTRAFSA